MSETISSGLTLVIPTVGQTDWATVIRNQCFVPISEHTHTGSGDGNQIPTDGIAANAVTFAKMATVATDRLLGRDTAGTGNVEALTVGGGLEFTGSGGIQRSALTGDVTATAGGSATTIANDAVTTAKILDGAVTAAKLDANAVYLTGMTMMWWSSSAPSGWILAQGQTLGTAASGATLQGDDYQALYEYFWNSLADAQAPVSTGRGASAAADWAANKTLTIPSMRQRFPIGHAAAGTGSTLGGTGGSVDHTHTIPAHYHGMGSGADLNVTSSGSHIQTIPVKNGAAAFGSSGLARSNAVTDSNYNSNSDGSHTHPSGNFAGRIGLVTGGVDGNAEMTSGSNNPPFIALNFIVKL